MDALRPLSLGKLIDTSVLFWRQHFGAFFVIFVGFQLVQYALAKSYVLAITHIFPEVLSFNRLLETAKTSPQSFLESAAKMGVLGVVYLLLVFVLTNWASLVATAFGMPRYLHEAAPTVETALKQAVGVFGRLTATLILASAWGLGVVVVCLLPGAAFMVAAMRSAEAAPEVAFGLLMAGLVLSLSALALASLWFVMRVVIVPQVVFCESLTPMKGFARSGALTQGKVERGLVGWVKIRLTVLVTLVTGLLSLVSLLAGLPSSLLAFMYGNAMDPLNATPERIPALLSVPAELFQHLVSAGFVGLYAVFQCVFYIDMRCRREGFDLERSIS